MKSKSKKGQKPAGAKKTKKHVVREVAESAGGALAGAAIGAIAGPPGAIAGAVVGALAGAAAGAAVENDEEWRAAEERELDRTIGVSGGDLGAPNLKHPPAKIGAYSAASMGGGGSSDGDAAEGPISAPKK